MSKRKVEDCTCFWSGVGVEEERDSAKLTARSYNGISASATHSSGTSERLSQVRQTICWISRIVAASVRRGEGGTVSRKWSRVDFAVVSVVVLCDFAVVAVEFRLVDETDAEVHDVHDAVAGFDDRVESVREDV
jgi:hypothetical protein